MNGDNSEGPVRPWRDYAAEEWERITADPLTADEEPWRWSCPRCTAVLPRALVADHVAAHDEHPERVIAWIVIAALGWLLAGVAVWLVLRR